MKSIEMKRFATLLRLSAGVCGCAALPLIGALAAGRGIARYLEFPPMTRYIAHAPFDGRAFALLGALNLLMVAGIVVLLKQGHARGRRAAPKFRPNSPFPFWGWAAAAIMLLGWLLAWTRFPWFRFFQAHTFCLPWLGYIILANALCVWRSGRSPMTHATGRFLMLFGVSTLFWWFFEFLNRFVQNWYYVGVQGYSPLAYVFHASVAFSTVLPAVMSTHRLLMTYPLFDPGLTALRPVALPRGKPPAMIGLLASALGLALVGWFPDVLYPLVWAAPLLVLTSLQALSRRPTIFYGLRSGDWAELVSAALAALICGFFWELWNFKSLARWEYGIPFVDCCHVFAMPLLGYGGYLPFGLECLLVGKIVMGNDNRKTHAGWQFRLKEKTGSAGPGFEWAVKGPRG